MIDSGLDHPGGPTAVITQDGPIITITLKPIGGRLPLSVGGIADLSSALDAVLIGEVTPRPRALIITGSDQTFATGADLGAIRAHTTEENLAYNRALIDAFTRLAEADIPVIAAINGLALGGGLELALAADFRICSDHVRMGLPEVTLGLIPGAGGTQRLPRLIGESRAIDLLLTGRLVSADEALRLGLVNRVIPRPQLLAEAADLARLLVANAPLAQAVIKREVRVGRNLEVQAAIGDTHRAMEPLLASHDLAEGIDAFLNKRPPMYTGR